MCLLSNPNSHIKTHLQVLDRFKIPNNHTVLGAGEISQVILGFDTQHENTPVAIKKINKLKLKRNEKAYQRLQQEVSILQQVGQLDSEFFVKFYDTCEDDQNIYIITEFVEGGELFDLVEKFPYGVPELLSRKILKQIFAAVSLLHKHKIVHLDLKLENIMYNRETEKIKIIDFGFAVQVVDKQLNEFCGSTHYIAPQILHRIPYDGFKADVWSLGVITYALLCSRFPFDDENDNQREIIFKIKKGSFETPAHFSTQALSFVKQILNPNENTRPDCDCLQSHPFLMNV